MNNSQITVYWGDAQFFEGESEKFGEYVTSISEVIREIEALNNITTHVVPGQEADLPKPPHFQSIRVASADFAMLSESSVSNFVGLLNRCIWSRAYIHNPPACVLQQLKHAFDVQVVAQEPSTLSKESIIELNQLLRSELVGQEKAIESILSGLYSMTRIDRDRPVVLMFYGPSGVGKTQAAQIIGNAVCGGLMRKQFSMLHSEKFHSYIFGGSHSEASFARDLAERDSDVILLDEFDKCNPVFYSAFYELFDSGSFQDKNYEITLKSGVFICTANYRTLEEIKRGLGEPIYSRFDRFIQFDMLDQNEIIEVVDRIVSNAYKRLSDEEREVIDRSRLLDRLSGVGWGTGNIRQLKHFVDEAFDLVLVRELISGPKG